MNYQDQINAQRAERIRKQKKEWTGKMSTEFGDMIPAPGPSYVINEAGDEMINGKKYSAEEVSQKRWRDDLRQQIDKEQSRIDSIRSANAARWTAAQREREGQMGFRISNVVAHPPGKTELDASQRQLDRMKKSLATYTEKDQKEDAERGREKGFFSQVGKGITNTTGEDIVDLFAMGGASVETDTYTAMVLEKAHRGDKLSDIEQSLLNTWGVSQAAERYVASRGGATIAHTIGGSALPMAGYVTETLTTGIGGLLQQGAKLGIKKGIEVGIKTGIKVGAQSIGKKIGKVAGFEALRTPLRGSMYGNINERVVDQYSIDDQGKVAKEEVSPYEIGYKSYMQTLVESFSEQAGGMIDRGVIGKAVKKVSPAIFGKSIGGSMMAGVDRFASSTKNFWDILQKATNYNGVIDEFLEEEFSAIVEPIFTGEFERLGDAFTIKNQLTTLGAVAMAGVPAHVASTPSIIKGEIQDAKLRKQTNTAIASISDKTLRQGVFDALKKGQTLDQKADAISKLNWKGVVAKDAAAVADAFTLNIEREIYQGASQEMATQKQAAQEVKVASMNFSLYQNKDTGLVHELYTSDGQNYVLMTGSFDGKGADDILYVQDITTGETRQMAASNFVGERKISYDQVIDHLTKNLTEQITAEILQNDQTESDQDALESAVAPASYAVGEIVELADGRTAEFIAYQGDALSAEVAIENIDTGDMSAVTIARQQIVGLAPSQEIETNTAQNVEAKQPFKHSEQTQPIEIPLQKDGTPNYNEMDGEMFFDEYSKDFSQEEAISEMAEVVMLNKQKIERLRKNQSSDINVRAQNRRKIAIIEARNQDFEGVLQKYNNENIDQIEQTTTQLPAYKTIANELSAINSVDYLSVEDYVLRDLARGVKFRWADKGSSRGLATMLGYKGKEKERRTRIGIVGKEGRGIDEYSELIWSQIESLGVPHNGINDDTDVRDKVIDILQDVYSRGQAMARLRELHVQAPQTIDTQLEQEMEWRHDDMMREKQTQDVDFFASIDKPTTGEIAQRVDELNKIIGAQVKIVGDLTELPDELQSMVDDVQFDNKGISYRGVAYLNEYLIENMSDIESTYIHEVIGHQFIDGKIPIESRKKLFSAILKNLSLDQMIEQIPTFVEVAQQYRDGIIDEIDVAREYVAYWAQTYLTTNDLSIKNKDRHLTFDIDETVSEQNIIEILKQLSNGIQSIEIRTARGNQQSDYANIYSAWRSKNFQLRSANSNDRSSQDSDLGEESQQQRESDVEGESKSGIRSARTEVWDQGKRGTTQIDVDAGQRMAAGDGARAEQRATEVEDNELRFREADQTNSSSALIAQAKEIFGETTNFNEAGYLTPDGTLLDFSGKKHGGLSGGRYMDHREVADIDVEMSEFMDIGNVRLSPESGSIQISQPLTKQQEKTLSKYINHFDGKVYLDFTNSNHFVEYNAAKSSKVIADINNYFTNDILPQNSVRFSEADNIDGKRYYNFRHQKIKTANSALLDEKIDAVLQKMTDEFGIESVSVQTKRELPLSVRNRSIGVNFKGAYDPMNGAVYFVRGVIKSEADAVATFLHEVVAHKGIDGLLGRERAQKFYNAVLDSQSKSVQAALLEKYKGDKSKAGDEFVARIAEGNVSPGALQRAISAVRKFLRDVLGIKVKISDADIHYMLFLSKVSLQRAANLAEAMHAIEADGKTRRQIELSVLRMRDRSSLDHINDQFNEELTALQNGMIRDGHIFSLGMPSIALLSGGVPNLPIELDADRLREKSNQKEHPFDLSTVENLPKAIAKPIAVFDSRTDDNRKVIFTEINNGKMNFVVEADASMKRGRDVLTVNSIRSLYPEENVRVIRWINEGLMSWVDKTKTQMFIERQSAVIEKSDDKTVTRLEKMSGIRRSNYADATSPDGNDPIRALTDQLHVDDSELIDAAKVVENFKNPQYELRFSELEDQPHKNTKHKSGFGIQVQEAVQDATIKVHRLQNEIKAKGGVIDHLTNPYEAINHADSRAQAATERYSKQYIDPIAEMIERWTKEKVRHYEDVSSYLLAKHSIERQDSGINALNKESGWTRAEAQNIVEEFESTIDETEVTALWNAIRAATNELLDISVRSGRMSIDDKRDIVSHHWQYYVPLRDKDFDFEQIDDLRDVFYIDRKNSGSSDKVAAGQKAKGRTSKAADPISMLLYMASGEIVRSEHNIALRHLLRLVEKYSERTDLFTLKHEWSVKTEFGKWVKFEEQPPVEMIRASNAARKALRTEKDPTRRAELEAQITVTMRDVKPDKTYRGAYDPKSREVIVYKDGIRHIIVLDDIEVAQAINYRAGELQNWMSSSWILGRPARVMAQLSTSKNPAFIMPNFVRDIKNAAQYHFVDSDGNLGDFIGYALSSWKILDRNLRGDANPLTIAEIGQYDITDILDRTSLRKIYGKNRVNDMLYEMFVVNGGETGYVHIAEAKQTKRKLSKGIKTKAGHNYLKKGWKGVNNGLDYLANLSENAVRYATFIAQIDNGHSVFDAVSYAKNITVNFNRKGRYSKGLGSMQMFFNASIQAAVNQYSLVGNKQGKDSKTMTKQRLRFVIAKSITLSLGALSGMLVAKTLSSLQGDDDEQFTLSDWERMTNFILPIDGKGYIKIPVAQSERPIYALGVMFNDWMNEKIETEDMVKTFLSMFVDVNMPLSVGFDVNRDDAATWFKPIIPSAWKPLTDILYNEDFMGRPINKKSYTNSTPDSELGQKNVPQWLKTVTSALNKFGGGDEVTPAGTDHNGEKDWRNLLDISPSTIDYVIKSYMGGIGRIVSDVAKLAGSDPKEARYIPIANRFYGEFYEKNPSSEYWERSNEIKYRDSHNRKAEAKGIKSTKDDEQFKMQSIEDATWRERLRITDKQIKLLKEQLEGLPENSVEFEQKEKEIKRIQRHFNQQYNAQHFDAQHN